MALASDAAYYVVGNHDKRTKSEFPWRLVYTKGGKKKPILSRYTEDGRDTVPALFKEKRFGQRFLQLAREHCPDFTVMDEE